MSHKSFKAKATHVKRLKPVIVKGYKRIFNISEDKGKSSDILNVKKSTDSKFNGLLFEVDEKELDKLTRREDWYNFEEASYYDFKTKKKIGKALVCVDYYLFIDKGKKLPEKKYFILCREAAYNISKEFGKFWDDTTFTSRGQKISAWINKHKEYDTLD